MAARACRVLETESMCPAIAPLHHTEQLDLRVTFDVIPSGLRLSGGISAVAEIHLSLLSLGSFPLLTTSRPFVHRSI